MADRTPTPPPAEVLPVDDAPAAATCGWCRQPYTYRPSEVRQVRIPGLMSFMPLYGVHCPHCGAPQVVGKQGPR